MSLMSKRLILLSLMVVRFSGASDWWASQKQQRPALRVRSSPRRLLQIYLADHLAAGTAGVALVRRAARSNNGTSTGEFLHRLSSEIAADLETLRRVVSQLGFTSSPPKEIIAAVLEKLGRLKPNGQLRGYSP